jgi:hypothetical protein
VSAGGVVASGGGGVSDGIGAGAGSDGIVDGAVSAGGVMVALSSFLAQPAASNRVETASKAKARMASSSRKFPMESGPLLSGPPSRWFQRSLAHDECQCFVNDKRCVDHRVIFIMRA